MTSSKISNAARQFQRSASRLVEKSDCDPETKKLLDKIVEEIESLAEEIAKAVD